jgi:hypothetical protein
MIVRLLAVSLAFVIPGSAAYSFSSYSYLPELSTMEVLDKVHAKIASSPQIVNWQASVLTTLYEMDKNWEPKKKTIIQKLTAVRNKKRTEKILSATEYNDDKTKDVTAKYQTQAAKFNKKNEADANEEGKRRGGRHRGLDLERDEFFPFSASKKKDYEYKLHLERMNSGQNVYVLETRSHVKSSDNFEGKYHIHPETFDVLHAVLRPAKFPGPLKLLEMHIDFDRLPEGYLVIKAATVRIHVGLIVKNIRMESEEIYSDYKVFD